VTKSTRHGSHGEAALMVGVLRRDTIVSFMLRLLVKFTVKRRKYRPFPNTIVAAPKNGIIRIMIATHQISFSRV
jgi:hypothetical protein